MSHTAVSFPLPGRLRLNGARLLSSPLADECRAFVAALFHLPDVLAIEINSRKASAEIRFNSSCTARDIARHHWLRGARLFVERLTEILRAPQRGRTDRRLAIQG